MAYNDTNTEDIAQIKELIAKHGRLTENELGYGKLPTLFGIGNTFIEVKALNGSDVELTTIVNGEEMDFNDMSYEDLPENTLADILQVVNDYDVEDEKTQKRIQN